MKMKGLFMCCAAFMLSMTCAQAQVNNEPMVEGGYFDSSELATIDYADFQLPPLGTLFDNARSNPSIELLEKERQIEAELLKKEKKEFLSWFHARAQYTYGIMDNYGSGSDVMTPIYYQYVGTKQHYWNLGAQVNIPLDDAFDLGGRVKRQKLNVEKAEKQKEIEYEALKQQIATLYVRITNNLVAIKTSAENAAVYKGAGHLQEQQFKVGEVEITSLAETKRWENTAIQQYQTLQSSITTDILILEIMTHTPIITNVIAKTKLEQKGEALK
ncbi:MAG: TolC family protein [Bacteroidaceae bacterium]|nr:TolC family protein [Bacteroidaceae bacterium]